MTQSTDQTFPRDTLITPLIIMVNDSVPVSTFIDVGDHDGVIRVNAPQYEYWLSTAEHIYSAVGQIELPYRKLDSICAEVGVQGYFVSKPMPAEAVRGWSKIWDDTH